MNLPDYEFVSLLYGMLANTHKTDLIKSHIRFNLKAKNGRKSKL